MALLCVLVYIFLISAFGCLFLRKSKIDPVLVFPTGFMIGSIIMGVGMFLLVSANRVTPIPISLLALGVLFLGIFGWGTMLRSLKAIKHFLFARVFTGKYRTVILILVIAGLVLYFANAYTPPRSADAMRYHLAQIKDTVRHKGFVYRPYYHYNFPQYFHYLSIPVYMIVGGMGVQLSACFYFILTAFLTLYMAAKTNQTKQLLFLALFLVFIPVYTKGANAANSDFAVIFYGLMGLLLIIEFDSRPQGIYLVLAYASFGFALGSKYQAILYLPLYLVATFLVVRRRWSSSFRYAVIIPLGIISLLVASPFFIRNFHYTGDPVWPLLQDLFHVEKDYLYQITQATTRGHQGQLGITAFVKSIVKLATYEQIIPVIWILWIGYYFTRFPLSKFYKIGTLLYFFGWFLLQPNLYPRFAIYILPIIAIMAVSFCEWCYNKRSILGKVSYGIAILSIAAGIGISMFYSLDFIKYHITRDLEQYHQHTWYYDQYKWINQNVKNDGNILAIVASGHTYYLDKEYLRADPELSGLIDWPAIGDVEELKDRLRELKVRYIFYDDRNWVHPGGSNMMRLIRGLKEEKGVSVLLEDDNLKLTTLRVLRKYQTTKVFLLDLSQFLVHNEV